MFLRINTEIHTIVFYVGLLVRCSRQVCPSGWSDIQEKCVRLQQSETEAGFTNIYEAREKCRSLGGDLVSFDSLVVEEEVLNFVSQRTMSYHRIVYIGLNDLLREDNFTWFDGTEIIYTRWREVAAAAANEDRKDCMAIENQSKFFWWTITNTFWKHVSCCKSINVTLSLCQLITNNSAQSQRMTEILAEKCFKGIRCHLDVNLTSYRTHRVADVVNYSCPENMTFGQNVNFTSMISKCQPDGVWIPEIPPCEVTTCEEPALIQNAAYRLNSYLVHSEVRYKCEEGYQFNDGTTEKRAVCKGTRWQPVIENCTAVKCPLIPVWKGLQPNTTAYTYGSAVSYTCNMHQRHLEDNNQTDIDQVYISICTPNKTWSPPIPLCSEQPEFKRHPVKQRESVSIIILGLISVMFVACEIIFVVLIDYNHLTRDFRILKRNVSEGMSRLRRTPAIHEEKDV